ncbi:MAG: hypothetical protein QF864_15105 [SAR202 cluster bacterium]|jgi:hypothetical protein|nr:hypothetical protein [SAR202 cluster bacterium]
MALRFLEYKHDRHPEGGKIRPLWVDEGGVFYNTANHSYAGCCADDEVKVPDSVTQYANKAALQDRNKALHAVTPFQKLNDENDPTGGHTDMNDTEVEEMSDGWWNSVVAIYS